MTNLAFGNETFRTLNTDPSSSNRLFIIQWGMYTLPSAAVNSSTPQCVLLPLWVRNSNSMG